MAVALARDREQIHHPGIDRRQRLGQVRKTLRQLPDPRRFKRRVVDKDGPITVTGRNQRLRK